MVSAILKNPARINEIQASIKIKKESKHRLD
jgi:hypothetical protein